MESRRTFVGLDVHRKVVVATALNAEGEELSQVRLSSAPEELVDFLQGLPGQKHVALEACTMWEPYFDTVASTSASVTLSHPLKTRLIADASLKSDKVDSEALARLLRLNALPTAFAPPPELRQLRALVKDRLFYKRSWKRVANHVYHRLMRNGVRYEDGILQLVRKRESLRTLGLDDVDRGLDALQDMEVHVRELDRAIHTAWTEWPEAQLLTTIPGIGELTAVTLVAYLCPIDRFNNMEEVTAYAGLVPTSYQSADRAYHGRVRRDCNGLLRWVLIEACWSHRRFDPKGDVAKFARRISRRRGQGKGMVAASRKLLRVICAILKEKRPYSSHAPGEPAASIVRQSRKTAAR